MTIRIAGIVLLCALAGATLTLHPAVAEPVSFTAADGVRVFADLQSPPGPTRGTLVLLHMAGSNRGEYRPIAPVLNRAGFATLAVDLRSGGRLWDQANETAKKRGGAATYAETLPDIEAALAFVKSLPPAPVALWGSSYSSALVFVEAERHPDVAAVLAFSPAEYIPGYSIRDAAAKLKVPVFITSAADPDEVASARALGDAVPGGRATVYVPRAGVHGASTLRTDQNPEGAIENMRAVMRFLDHALPTR